MKKIFLFVIIFISLIGLKILILTPLGWTGNLINPMGQKSQSLDTISTPVPTPNTPKTFRFDSSTDLKKELDSINPQILDSDFKES